ncbi:MAG TPA: toll/interleukin-1 receptor domain-containing protein [Ktedonosporobacter sp.]|nr:toll/interleukin-1 receptor domain-containing protein [Ktedonosporobacter sp.]
MMESRRPIKVFISYAYEDHEWLKRLIRHLGPFEQQGRITIWDRSLMEAGVVAKIAIEQQLSGSDVILLLISDHYLGSRSYYTQEMMPAIEQHKQGKARTFPILLSPVIWRQTPLATLQILPSNAIPITLWGNVDLALTSIVEEIGQIVDGTHL